ncbi:autotransporter assembly complex protein TamA [Hartmannibacter diazotrophicus]|nr:autotransporter assembly complex family protein [Hartmannibacter diazotrophicus]
MAALAFVPVIPAPAFAFEIFGYTFFESKKSAESESPDAQHYTIELDIASDSDDLKNRVESASLLYSGRDSTPPPSSAAFLSRLDAEYGRIVAALYTEGYYGGTVAITVDGKDASAIPLDAELPKTPVVKIDVNPGRQFRFGQVDISGRAPQPPPKDDRPEKTIEELGLVPGQVAKSTIVLQSEQSLIDEWRQLGYPKANIALRDAVADHPTDTLDVSVGVASGPPAVYGDIGVTGTEKMNPDFIVKQSGLKPGQPYDPDDLAKAQKQLRRLQVFNAVRVVEGDTVAPDGGLPITLNVVERKRHLIGGGVSYSTTDGVGLDGYWEHRNLFGQAEKLRLDARVGGIQSVNPEDFTYALGATFTKPGIYTPTTDLIASILAQREVVDAYTEESVTGQLGFTHEFDDRLKGSVAGSLAFLKTDDNFGKRDFIFASLPSSLEYDGSNDEKNPTSGYRTKLSLEPFYEANFGNMGVIASLEGSVYVPLGERLVLAARAGAGSILGAPADELPASRLFLLGGGQSIRGYGYRNVGPRLANGDVVGGRSYVEGSVEMRIKVTDSIGVVPFVDAGNAFSSSYPDFSEPVKIGAGIGLRYDTGLGPIRVDAAVPLNPDNDDPNFAIYIGLGQAF